MQNLTKEQLKFLLITNYNFKENTYLDEYLTLLYAPINKVNQYKEYHHVIPVCWYKFQYKCKNRREAEKYAHQDLNNFKVSLLYKDHCKAHYLLFYCLPDYLKWSTAVAYLQMISLKQVRVANKGTLILDSLTPEEFNELQCNLDNLKEDIASKFFSTDEYTFLMKNLPILGTAICAAQLGRTKGSVQNFAVANNLLKGGKHIFWTDEEKQWLIQNYTIYSRAECALYLNKTEASIHSMERTLKLSAGRIQKIKWTTLDDQWLLANYKILPTIDIMTHLNRSYNAIYTRLKILGADRSYFKKSNGSKLDIKQRRSWTVEDKQWLISNWSIYTIKECANYLNRTESSIEHMLIRLNIKLDSRHKKWNN